ncbi:hypothetical protein HK097_004632 [Rhizophlyctis rosea]|uniref:Uncharacterized protein n=1 Tax=Rhizophlyctis rosea TaxID=64517 RepID=A0AAD5S1B4_9FUNG|nr:hypothetical protein HK097_004632 [Rhizophlyctis rosea]
MGHTGGVPWHVVATYDLAFENLYVNGELTATRSLAVVFLGVNEPFLIGSEFSNGGRMAADNLKMADLLGFERHRSQQFVHQASRGPSETVALMRADPVRKVVCFGYTLGTASGANPTFVIQNGPLRIADEARLNTIGSKFTIATWTVATWIQPPPTGISTDIVSKIGANGRGLVHNGLFVSVISTGMSWSCPTKNNAINHVAGTQAPDLVRIFVNGIICQL